MSALGQKADISAGQSLHQPDVDRRRNVIALVGFPLLHVASTPTRTFRAADVLALGEIGAFDPPRNP
jgi:hypothetical protein